MIIRSIKILFSLIFSLLLFCLLLLFVAANSQTGLQITADQLQQHFANKLSIGNLNGKLVGPITINDLHYHDNTINVDLKSVTFKWSPLALLKYKLLINKINIGPGEIKLSLNQQTNNTLQIQSLPQIYINNLQINKLTLSNDLTPPSTIESLSGKALISSQEIFVNTNIKSSGAFAVQGNISVKGNINNLSFDSHLEGKFKQQPVLINTQASLIEQQINNINSDILIHNNSVHIKAKKDKHWNATWNIKIPNLNEIFSNAKGSIKSNGIISDKNNALSVQSSTQINNFNFKQYSTAQLIADIDYNINNKRQLLSTLSSKQIIIDDYIIKNINIITTGTPNKHQINAYAQHNNNKTNIKLTGNYLNKKWHGRINQLLINGNTTDQWSLQKPSNLQATINKITLSPTCLLSTNTSICIQTIWQKKPQTFTAEMQISNLTLQQIKTFLPNNLPIANMQGRLDGKFSLSRKNKLNNISAKAKLSNGSFHLPEYNLDVNNINIQFYNPDQSTLKFTADATTFNHKVTLYGSTKLNDPNLITKIKLNGNDLKIINTNELKITASPDLDITLTANQIKIYGDIFIPQASITPHDFGEVVTLPNNVTIHKSRYQNKIKKEKFGIYTDVNIKLGDKIKLELMGIKGNVNGSLHIIENPKQVMSATGQLTLSDGSYTTHGEKLTVRRGHLNYTGGPITNPHLNISAIRSVKTPSLANSSLQYRQEIIVGINITGTLDNPHTSLFSEPSILHKAEIVSYLVLGSSNTDALGTGALIKAASSFKFGEGTEDSGFGLTAIKSGLQKGLGLTEFNISSIYTTTEKNKTAKIKSLETALVLGKFLTPELYIKYMQGLSESFSTFSLQYFINKNWSILGQSGNDSSSIDIYYTIERE